jgi:O-antigen ligase/tetratricopeptide (TPR) repeat protein
MAKPGRHGSGGPLRNGTGARAGGFSLGIGLLLIHLALSPLVFWRETTEAFEFNKVLLLRAAALALGALALTTGTGQLIRRERSLRELLRPLAELVQDPVALGFLLFAVSALVSTGTSLSPRTSLDGAPESFAGLSTVLAYTALFAATRWLAPTAAAGRCLLLGPVLAAGVASTYALVQVTGTDPLDWGRVSDFAAFVRPFATLGHPNFLAAFLVMTGPLVAVFAREAAGRRQWLPLAALALTGALSALAVVLALSRGAWLAAVCAGVTLLAGWGRSGLRRRAPAGGAVLVVGAAGLGLLALLVPGGTALAARVGHLGDDSGRLHVWRAGLAIFRDHPLLGCGLDAFQLAFPGHRTVAYWLAGAEWGVTPLKAHNEAVHILATQGLLGAGAVLFLTAALVRAGVRAWQRAWQRARPDDRPLVAALAAGIVAFYVQNLFSFTVAGCGTLFVTQAALLAQMARPQAPEPSRAAPTPGRWPLLVAGILAALVFAGNVAGSGGEPSVRAVLGCVALLGAVGLGTLGLARLSPAPGPDAAAGSAEPRQGRGRAPVLQGAIWAGAAFLLWPTVLCPLEASRACSAGEQLLAADPHQAIARLDRAVALAPATDLYWAKLGTALQAAARAAADPAECRDMLVRARTAFERAEALVPVNPYHHANLGAVLAQLAGAGLARPDQALTEFDAALAADRNNAYFYVDAGSAALEVGNPARARAYAARGIALYPRFAPAHALLGDVALAQGKAREAVGPLGAAVRHSWYGDDEGHRLAVAHLATALLQLARPDEALRLVRPALARAPEDVELRLRLAEALAALGRRDEARAEYRRIREQQADPDPGRRAVERLAPQP